MEKGKLELKITEQLDPWDVSLELKGDVNKNSNNVRMSDYPEAVSNLHDLMKSYKNHTLSIPGIEANNSTSRMKWSLNAYADVHNQCVKLSEKISNMQYALNQRP